MKKTRKKRGLPLVLATCMAAGGVGMAHAATYAITNQPINIAPYCGTKPIRVALVDGYGGNTWRKTTLAELRDEASKCPNIKHVAYTNADGSEQTYNAAINSYTAQGYNIIIAFTDFGDASLPAYRSAFQAGVTIVPYLGRLDGQPGTDYAANVYQAATAQGEIMGEWLGKALHGKGNVLMLGGPAGAASSARFLTGFKEGIAKYPGLVLLDKNYVVTNWNPAYAQQATSGLIAKYPKIDGIASDYGVTALAAIKAFQQAGLKVPAIATSASNNQLDCKYDAAVKAGTAWPYLALDGTTRIVRFALQRALAAYNHVPDSEPSGILPYVFADSTQNILPKCDPNAPPDADLSSSLSSAQLNALFAR